MMTSPQEVHLFESLKDLLSLREVSEEELESSRDQVQVVVHRQMEQNSEEGLTLATVQIQLGAVLAVEGES